MLMLAIFVLLIIVFGIERGCSHSPYAYHHNEDHRARYAASGFPFPDQIKCGKCHKVLIDYSEEST